VDLQERLEVQVGHLLAILDTQELAQLGVRNDAALEVRVKAVVLLDILRNELRHIRLRALRLGRKTHERRELIRNRAKLQEGVIRTARLPSRTLLRRERSGVNTAAALRVTRLALEGLRGVRGLMDKITDTRGDLRRKSTELRLERRKDSISRLGNGGGGGLGGGNSNRSSRNGGRRGDNGDSDLGLGRALGGGLGRHVCICRSL
jgi:hypothetical protein